MFVIDSVIDEWITYNTVTHISSIKMECLHQKNKQQTNKQTSSIRNYRQRKGGIWIAYFRFAWQKKNYRSIPMKILTNSTRLRCKIFQIKQYSYLFLVFF